ncbi:ParB/RepB/Spo0J family partition protein [Escherichia coli]|uniref:ParB/RepB/Spo0J family partition protein n=1 Tax=Escherichia coli TaxID=562 RepID=UPI0002CA7283|nr:ParB/RepB/Spo0J family partition protein [Escherichia coli]EHK8249396.1 ParB/RepB/Spo0J family partition protein [Escherichia coli]EHW4719315.1 ParB/RepB/Spo0J family partition protein [Escherichia coli]EHW5399512.1 ParB/RepB/Spo0J family partition protein [Escherichia coli]EKB6231790.1 ParB/RepB/Spo0J family partition protein [Escherichia coli]EMX24584.1 parB-like nuclease domain protein [Escherichia coli P0301867.1]
MSVTESKAKAPQKTSPRKITKAQEQTLKAALEAAVIEYVPLSGLVKSPLNVRTIPYSEDSVRGLADSIESLGLLQNLIVHTLADGKSGVAAGGRRLTALQLLAQESRLAGDHSVMVKRVSDDIAALASVAENEQRAAMHPAEQIAGFRTLAEQGKTPAQIGDALGFSSRHVRRMLKLANLAPSLMEKLAQDDLTVEQCQALCLEDDHARQVGVYESVKASWSDAPAHLIKRAITETEMRTDSPKFRFIGRELYESAGGEVREDLFSALEGDGTADSVLVERLVQEKLESAALAIELQEGWSWSLAREGAVRNYGDDREHYLLLPEPETQYTTDEQQRLDELYATQEASETYDDEAAIQLLIDEIEHAASIRAWTQEQKAACGVVVSLYDGELYVQRGVQKKPQNEETGEQGENSSNVPLHVVSRQSDVAEGISAPLLKKMSSERTLAVQAALVQQPEKAVALMVWRLCSCVFDYCNTTPHPFVMRLEVHHSGLTSEAPSGKSGHAWLSLMQEKARLEALLPEGWKKDYTTFFTLDGQTLMSLMAFCTACSVDGVQARDNGHTSRSPLDSVEAAIGFHLRDWWQPTAKNFLGLLSKKQIVEALKEAGLSGAASDAGNMKKGDAASHAEQWLSGTRWVPGWMRSPDVLPDVADGDETNSDEHTAHAA